jgi:hypothetical protein
MMQYIQNVTPNLDPVVYVKGKVLLDWLGWCLATVETAFGTPRKYGCATDAWNGTNARHEDRNFPVGVYFPIWFSYWATIDGEYKDWGHVAIAYVNPNGSMNIWTSPWSHKPYFDTYSSVDRLAAGYHSTYVGWSEDLSGVSLISGIQPPPPFTFVIEAVNKQVFVTPDHHKWNLDRDNFEDICNNPIGNSPADPITIQGILHRSDIPQYSYYIEDVNSHQGYNTLDCNDYVPPAAPTPPEVPIEPVQDPVPEPAAPAPVPESPSMPEPPVPEVPNPPAKPATKTPWWVSLLIKLFPSIFHKTKR